MVWKRGYLLLGANAVSYDFAFKSLFRHVNDNVTSNDLQMQVVQSDFGVFHSPETHDALIHSVCMFRCALEVHSCRVKWINTSSQA